MSVFNSPKIEVFVGATGSGKGVGINRRLSEIKPKRLLIYDPRDEYDQHAPAAHRLSEVLDAFKRAKGGPVRVRFVPGDDVDLEEAYGFLCRLAFQDQKLREDRGLPPEPLVFLGEELSDVTKPSYAPPAWRKLITQGRHVGAHLIACTQRPALIDKTVLSAATVVRCYQLGYDDDVKVMAKELRVSPEFIHALQTDEDETVNPKRTTIRYIERLRRERQTIAGLIVVQGKKFSEKRGELEPPKQGAT